MNFDVSYGITKRLTNVTLVQARERVATALQQQGFGVLTEIDVQATLKKKLGVETAPYVILGACNPTLAHQALQKEPAIGLLLPCNVVLAEDAGDVVVSAASPRSMFSLVEAGSDVANVATEAEKRLRAALDNV
ncbi:MAG: DUF302 domain-containing protein [Polyangiaceae bacterium]|nr:DUF302 domain-containing protein [Polyangiaceae bacterium]